MPFPPVKERIILREADRAIIAKLAAELSVPEVIATILAARNLTTFEACKSFFNPDIKDLHDPFLFPGMDTAVQRIRQAIDKKQKIAVYGDYDVDGITATALVIRILRGLGADCRYYLPNRLTQGYGISQEGIEALGKDGVSLIISVDCGITAIDEVEKARSLGMDFIVTDHHEPKEKLPAAIAVINPKTAKDAYPDQGLAGVGVALKLCQALCRSMNKSDEVWMDLIELAAVGTAADIVPMTGENRIITSVGFERLRTCRIPGLRALIAAQGLTGTTLSTHHVVFQLAPCINAVGRLGDPTRGIELLLTEDENQASMYAHELVEANKERRAIHQRVEKDACAWVYDHCDAGTDYGIVAAQKGWHVGVIGIVASKLVERFYRPSILFSIDDNGMARGSGRSISSLHLLDALTECSDLLEEFGGHAAAAGMSIKESNLDAFRSRFNDVVRKKVADKDLAPTIKADAEVSLADISPRILRIINRMEPFGPGNMRPVLICRNLKNRYEPRIVGDNHLKMTVTGAGVNMDAIAFDFGNRLSEIKRSQAFSLAFSLDENEYNGTVKLQMRVKGVEA